MPQKLVKALNIFTTIAVVLVVLATALVVAPRIFGIYPYAILSGSMEPEYPTGSLVYVKEVDTSTLAEGDVITYMISRDATVTHRITDIVQDEKGQIRYQTQGDANDQPDAKLVHPENVVGVPMLCVPNAGYVVNAATTPPGSFLLLSFMALVIMFMFLPDIFAKEEDEGAGRPGNSAASGSLAVNARNGGFEVPRGPGSYGGPSCAPAQQPWGQVGGVQQPAFQAPSRHMTPEECALMAQRELARRAAIRAAQSNFNNQPTQGGRPYAK